MSDREYWTKRLKDAERELDAARTRSALDAAAKRLMRAREALKRLGGCACAEASTLDKRGLILQKGLPP